MRVGREGGRTENGVNKGRGEERKKRREGQEIDTEIEGDKDKESRYTAFFIKNSYVYSVFF